MALVDRERRYVAVNDAAVAVFQYEPDDVIGKTVGRTVANASASPEDADWQTLIRNNELYGQRVITHPSGRSMRIGFAAHATTLDGEWLALFVLLSAKLEPQGTDLINATSPDAATAAPVATETDVFGSLGASLTPREREVVRRVALGRSTRQIAGDLNLSPATVRSHVRNAMVKVGAHTRAQLVALVLGDGLAGR
jgi:DNA-binding CsgD family transcriptional regulator